MPRGVNLRDEAALQQRLWTPLELRGNAILHMWLDAADPGSIPQAGGVPTAWNDKSGFNRHATAAGTNLTYADNTVSVTNAGSGRFALGTLPANTFACIFVGTPVAFGGHRVLLSNAANMNPFEINTGSNNVGVFVTATFTAFSGLATWAPAFGMGGMQINSSTAFSSNRDGGSVALAIPSAMTLTTTPILLNEAAGARGWGSLNEIVFISPAPISSNEVAWYVQKIEGYLAWKWTYTRGSLGNLIDLLPASHRYKRGPPLK